MAGGLRYGNLQSQVWSPPREGGLGRSRPRPWGGAQREVRKAHLDAQRCCFAVYTFDWPGHGKSRGKRGGHTSVEEAMEIIDSIIEELCEKPFLFGHSLGGLTVIRYAETRLIRYEASSRPPPRPWPKAPPKHRALWLPSPRFWEE
ncbi:alpha/beta hydrolase [Thermococcus peptonophilus]|uniref:alpha/beta hydrolase n=1 Tax=Thermococcus peptonophilus TaxID=53952 RepID=UPI0034656DB8